MYLCVCVCVYTCTGIRVGLSRRTCVCVYDIMGPSLPCRTTIRSAGRNWTND